MKGKKNVKVFWVLALVLALAAECFILPTKQASAAEAGHPAGPAYRQLLVVGSLRRRVFLSVSAGGRDENGIP